MNLASLLVRAARGVPERPAVRIGPDVHLTHATLLDRVASLASSLTGRLGLARGDRVALVMRNAPEYIEALFACWYAGLIAVPVNAKLHPREFDYILDHSDARLCLATPDLAEAVASLDRTRVVATGGSEYGALIEGEPAAPVRTEPTEIAWLFYTSGTTGRPKGAMLTHRNLLAMTLAYLADVDQITPADCILHAAPMSHGSGLYIAPHVAKGAAQIIPPSGGFDAAEVFDLVAALPGTTIFAAPTMVKRLIASPAAGRADTTNLKTIVYGGAPMYLADLDDAHALFGFKLAQIYGQGESPMTITTLGKADHADRAHPRYRERLASAGTAYTAVEVLVVDDAGESLPPDEVGEVIVRGDTVMSGYWQDPAATAKSLREGWLHTGDLGAIDADGYLTLKDRSNDLIISGGSNVYPREVEEVLLHHSDVAEVSVVGRPDPEWGEVVVAFVVPRKERTPDSDALDSHCLDHIARFKRPKEYYFVDALPKNNYGKVLKTELRSTFEAGGQSSP